MVACELLCRFCTVCTSLFIIWPVHSARSSSSILVGCSITTNASVMVYFVLALWGAPITSSTWIIEPRMKCWIGIISCMLLRLLQSWSLWQVVSIWSYTYVHKRRITVSHESTWNLSLTSSALLSAIVRYVVLTPLFADHPWCSGSNASADASSRFLTVPRSLRPCDVHAKQQPFAMFSLLCCLLVHFLSTKAAQNFSRLYVGPRNEL